MASETPTSLTDPVLIAPRHGAPIDVANLTFEWEPVELAQGYVLQVSQDTSFEHIVIDERVGDVTSYEASARFPDDRSTFFWRVMSEADGELSSGEHIESFTGMSTSDLESAPDVEPDTDESLGPYNELFKAAGKEAKVEVTGDSDKAVAEAEAIGVEPEGVESAQIMGIVVAILVAVAIISALLVFWKGSVVEDVAISQISVSGYPDLRRTEINAARQLTQYQVVNDAERTYQIPIDEAMRLMVNEERTRADSRQTSMELPPLYR